MVARTLLFIVLPFLLHAGWMDWFWESSPPEPVAFDCPHRCGQLGSKSLEKVTWLSAQALFELDRMSHAFRPLPFPYDAPPDHFDHPWFDDPWLKSVKVQVPEKYNGIRGCWPLHDSQWNNPKFECCCRDKDMTGPGHHWVIHHKMSANEEKVISYIHYYFNPWSEDFDPAEEPSWYFYFDRYSRILSLSENIPSETYTEYYQYRHDYLNERLSKLKVIYDLHDFKLTSNTNNINELSKLEPNASNSYQIELMEIKNKNHRKYMEEIDTEKTRLISEHEKFDSIYFTHMPTIQNRLHQMVDAYTSIFDTCIEEHHAPRSILERSRIHFELGNNVECIEDIKALFESCPAEYISDELREELERSKGISECETGLYEDAILTLTEYMKNHPHQRKDYLERAIAYFESGDLYQAMEDFSRSGLSADPIPPNWQDDIMFAKGVFKGLTTGAITEGADTLKFLGSSLSSLPKGVWALVTKPEEVSRKLSSALQEAIQCIRNEGIDGMMYQMFPEAKELLHKGNMLSYEKQGELIGSIAGKVGIELALLKGVGKGTEVYRKLREANAVLTFSKVSKSLEAQQVIFKFQRDWCARTAPIIEELKTTKRFDKEIYKTFKNQYLSETQVRQILHQAGFKTFRHPKGIPRDWKVTISKKDGGMRYQKLVPGKDGELKIACEVRVMPGKPNSKFPAQRNPYVQHQVHGDSLDIHGNVVFMKDPEAHIPLGNYNFEKLTKLSSYD